MSELVDEMRQMVHASLRDLDKGLAEGKEVMTSIFIQEKEFRMIVTAVSSFEPKFMRLTGVTEQGQPMRMIFPVDQVTFKFEVTDTGKAKRIGFAPD